MRRRIVGVLIWICASAGLLTVAAHPALALGAEVHRTDSNGTPTTTIVKVGDTGPACCCAGHDNGEIHLGVRVCYLPL